MQEFKEMAHCDHHVKQNGPEEGFKIQRAFSSLHPPHDVITCETRAFFMYKIAHKFGT